MAQRDRGKRIQKDLSALLSTWRHPYSVARAFVYQTEPLIRLSGGLINRLEFRDGFRNSLLREGIFQNLINRNAKLIAMHESAGSLLTDEKRENFNLIIGKIQLKSSKDSI